MRDVEYLSQGWSRARDGLCANQATHAYLCLLIVRQDGQRQIQSTHSLSFFQPPPLYNSSSHVNHVIILALLPRRNITPLCHQSQFPDNNVKLRQHPPGSGGRPISCLPCLSPRQAAKVCGEHGACIGIRKSANNASSLYFLLPHVLLNEISFDLALFLCSTLGSQSLIAVSA